MPESPISFFFAHFLSVLQALHDGLFLLEIGLAEHVVSVFKVRVLQNLLCLLDFHENLGRVNSGVLVGVVFESSFLVPPLEVGFVKAPG